MLIAKGHSVVLFLADGSTRRPVRGAALLHDPSGEVWPYASGLMVKFTRGSSECDDPEAREYFGDEHPLKQGSVTLPPVSLDGWTYLGEVKRIEYVRKGTDHHGLFEHTFKDRHGLIFAWGGLPNLYGRGDAMRLELTPGTKWDWAGISD